MVEVSKIKSNDGRTIAIVVRKDFKKEGVNFISDPDFPLQLGISNYKENEEVKAHFHIENEIKINKIQEIIYIKKGKALANLYNKEGFNFKSVELTTGDIIFFIEGGHGFKMLEETDIIEVKQGPYFGRNKDKRMIE